MKSSGTRNTDGHRSALVSSCGWLCLQPMQNFPPGIEYSRIKVNEHGIEPFLPGDVSHGMAVLHGQHLPVELLNDFRHQLEHRRVVVHDGDTGHDRSPRCLAVQPAVPILTRSIGRRGQNAGEGKTQRM